MNDVVAEAPSMYGNMMQYVAGQQADGEVDRREFEPDSTAAGWPATADSDVRARVERFVAKHIPEAHKFVDAGGKEKVIYLDERGRSASCPLEEVPDGELMRMAERYGMRFNGGGRPGKNDQKPGMTPDTSRTDHGYSKPRTEDTDGAFEGALTEGKGLGLHKAASSDEHLGAAYRDVLGLKGDLDRADEIPANMKPLYKQATKAMGAIAQARKETAQLRGMAKRAAG